MVARRQFSREFKMEAVKLVAERGVAASQVAKDLDIRENVLRKWVREQPATRSRPSRATGRRSPDWLR